MCKRLVWIVIVSSLLTGAGLVSSVGPLTNGPVHAQEELIVTIDELAGSGVYGDATLIDNGDGTTTIDVLVTGATGAHPIHVQTGTCETLGDIVFALTNVDAVGGSVTDIDVSLDDLFAATPLSINLHLSADEIGTYIACGTINDASQPLPSDSPPAKTGNGDAQPDSSEQPNEEILYVASNNADFAGWQADFWQHDGDMLSTQASSQTYILAPYEIPPQAIYSLEAEVRIPGAFRGELPCTSYFGFMLALTNPAEGVFVGLDQIGDPEQACLGRYAAWTPWIEEDEPLDSATGAEPPDSEWHTYRLEVKGSQIRFSVDGAVVFRSTKSHYTVIGGVGIVSGNLALELRRFTISKPAGSNQPPPAASPDPSVVADIPVLIGEPVEAPSGADAWSQYANDVMGLTLSYPSDWTVIETDDRYFAQFLPPGEDPEAPSTAISIFFAPTLPFRSDDELSGVSDPEVFVVSGITGRAYHDVSDDIPLRSTYVEIPLQGGTLFFSATLGPDTDLRPVFDQLLSTVVVQEST